MDNFCFYLLAYQIICMLTDMNFHFLMQPIPLFPIIAGYCVGFLAKFLNIYTHFLIVLHTSWQVIESMWLVVLFVKKHETLAGVVCSHTLPKKIMVLGLGIFGIILMAWSVTLGMAGMERDKQMDYVRKNFPNFTSEFSRLPNFAIYELNIFSTIALLIAFFGDSFAVFLFFLTTFDIFRILKKVRTTVSKSSFQKYKSAVYSLLAQLMTSLLCIGPLLCFVFLVIIGFKDDSGIWVQFIGFLYSMHSTVNSMVLIGTTPSFRSILWIQKKKVKPMFYVSVIISRISK